MFEKINERSLNTRERKFSMNRDTENEAEFDDTIVKEKIRKDADRKLDIDIQLDQTISVNVDR